MYLFTGESAGMPPAGASPAPPPQCADAKTGTSRLEDVSTIAATVAAITRGAEASAAATASNACCAHVCGRWACCWGAAPGAAEGPAERLACAWGGRQRACRAWARRPASRGPQAANVGQDFTPASGCARLAGPAPGSRTAAQGHILGLLQTGGGTTPRGGRGSGRGAESPPARTRPHACFCARWAIRRSLGCWCPWH